MTDWVGIPIDGDRYINVKDITRRPRGIISISENPEASLSVFRNSWWGGTWHEENPNNIIPLLIIELPTGLGTKKYTDFSDAVTKLWKEHYEGQGN